MGPDRNTYRRTAAAERTFAGIRCTDRTRRPRCCSSCCIPRSSWCRIRLWPTRTIGWRACCCPRRRGGRRGRVGDGGRRRRRRGGRAVGGAGGGAGDGSPR